MHVGRRVGNNVGNDQSKLAASIMLDRPARRQLDWTPWDSNALFSVAVDGEEIMSRITDGTTTVEHIPDDAREGLEVWEFGPQNVGEGLEGRGFYTSPADCVDHEWTAVSGLYKVELYRSTTSGVYNDPPIETFDPSEDREYRDGPVDSDTYYYKLTVEDEPGNSADSNETDVTIAAPPGPPTSVGVSHNDGTGATTVSWTKDAGATGYYLYSGTTSVDLEQTPTDLGDVASTVIDNSGQTGQKTYLVTSYSANGESRALSAMVTLWLDSGAEVTRPNQPYIVQARAAAGGEIEVLAEYVDTDEAASPATIKMYVNDGAGGAMDWGTPVASVNLDGYLTQERKTLTSTGLTGGLTYLVGIRAVTSGDIHDGNTTTESVTTDDTAPSAPTLTSTVGP
jgi:hypothetical protein